MKTLQPLSSAHLNILFNINNFLYYHAQTISHHHGWQGKQTDDQKNFKPRKDAMECGTF